MSPQQTATRRRRLVGAALALLILTGLALIALGTVRTATRAHSVPAITKGAAGLPIEVDAPVTPAQAAKQDAVDADGADRVQIPALAFDVPLGAISVADGVLTPPGVLSAYWVRGLGVPVSRAREGAVIVIIHSIRGDTAAPGNKLIDLADARSSLKSGMEIDVAGARYRVTKTENIARDALPIRADVWAKAPGRLVLITCLQRPGGGPAIDNVVAWAQLAR